MKPNHFSIMAIIAAAILVVPIGISALQQQQAYAPRECPGCGEFKKMTHEFEKNVIEAASVGNPDEITRLLEQYNLEVSMLFTGPE